MVTLELGDVLMWLTGSKFVPAIGLPRRIDIFFDNTIQLPRVHTCAPHVTFPVIEGLRNGRKSVRVFTQWILDSPGFGQV